MIFQQMQKSWCQHSTKMIRFSIVGSSNMLISYVMFQVILELSNIAYISQVLSYAAGIVWSYLVNSRWTFQQTNYKRSQLFRFIVLQISLLIFSSAILGLTVDILYYEHNISWLGTMTVVTVINYYLSHHWVFDKITNTTNQQW